MLPQRFRLRRLRRSGGGGGGEEQERAGDVEGSGPAAAGLGQDVGTVVFDAQRVCRCSKTGVISAEGHAVCQRDGILRDRHGYGNVRVEKPVRDLRFDERVRALGQLAELQAAVRIADGRTDDGPRGIRQRKFRAGQRRLGRAVHLFHAEAREAHPGPDRVGSLDRGGLHGPEANLPAGLHPIILREDDIIAVADFFLVKGHGNIAVGVRLQGGGWAVSSRPCNRR